MVGVSSVDQSQPHWWTAMRRCDVLDRVTASEAPSYSDDILGVVVYADAVLSEELINGERERERQREGEREMVRDTPCGPAVSHTGEQR